MNLNQAVIDEYVKYGVVIIRNVISLNWLKQLSIGVEKNFNSPS